MTDNRPTIAFYAPLKAPDHPVPSGDRLMARMLLAALDRAGFSVSVASDLRARVGAPDDIAGWENVNEQAADERARITSLWRRGRPPALWFTYHSYYKSPDLIGPPLARAFGLPYVTCESSWSARRDIGVWEAMQAAALDGIAQAALNLCLTARDERGLAVRLPDARLARIAPFIDTRPFERTSQPEAGHIVTVAMMRPGDKLDSYRHLAHALGALPSSIPWHLSIAGDGPAAAEVRALFNSLPGDRIRWLGALDRDEVAALLSTAQVYVWPGIGEAYGLSYLEAAAAGAPVVAFDTAGVPEVAGGAGGTLMRAGDDAALADAIAALLADPARAAAEGQAARARILASHSLDAAARRLATLLHPVLAEGSTA